MKTMRTRLGSVLLALTMILTFLPITVFADGAGAWDGSADTSWYQGKESESSYTISDAADLAGLAQLVNGGIDFSKKAITLNADIDLGGQNWTPIGTKDNPFNGTFDGAKADSGNYTISNLTVNGTGYLGLFGVTNGAKVQNLTLSNVNITGSSDHVGALAGQTIGTTLSNVTVKTAVVTSTKSGYAYVGGLTGEGYTGTIDKCMVDGLTLNAKGSFIGGISSQGYAKINNCTVQNSFITSTDWKVGGIIGQLNEGSFDFSNNKVLNTTITSTSYSGSVGGIIGFSNYGKKTLTNNTVQGVTLNSSTGAGGLIGSISSSQSDSFQFSQCTVSDLTFTSEGTVATSGGLVGQVYWRGSEGTTLSANDCTVNDVKVDADEGSKVGALFGQFSTSGNTYVVTNVTVTAGESENSVSQLVGNPNLGSSTFTMSGSQTKIDADYAGEAVDYLEAGTVLEKNEDGTYGVSNSSSQNYVAFNRDQIAYYTSLNAAFAGAKSGDRIVVMANESSGTATLNVSVTLDPGSYSLPNITVSEGANLTISGSGTLNAALTNNGTVTVDQNTTVTSYTGPGILATNESGKRVKWDDAGKKLVLYDIPYVFEINGVKYEAEDMADMAASIGASWDADSKTLTLKQDVSITGTIGVMQTMTLELNGCQLVWPASSNTSGNPLVVAESGTTLTVQDSSTAQTGRLVAEKSNVFQGDGKIVLKSGTVEAKSNHIYYAMYSSAGLDIQGGTVIVAKGQSIVNSGKGSYVNITGGTFNVLPSKSSVETGYAVVQINGSYRALPEDTLESGIAHGAVIATQVNGLYYASLENAIHAAMAGDNKTITLLSNITADSWNMIWNIQGITLDGDGHTIKVNDIQSGQNHDALFHSIGGNTFKNLTIDLSGVTAGSLAQGSRAISAAAGDVFQNVTILGNQHVSYGITVSGTEAANETVTIDNCTFQNLGYAVYDSESGDVENLIIKNSHITGCDYAVILHSQNAQFTDNTVNGGKLNILTNRQTITDNTFTGHSRIKFYDNPKEFERNNISSNSYLDADDDVKSIDVSKNYWGGGAPSADQLNGVSVTGKDVYYVNDTMNPEDLNTYNPPSGGGSTVSGNLVIVDSGKNGKVTVSPQRAEKGETVTITVKPDAGYELDELTVTDKDGDSVKLTDKGDGKYTFKMPDTRVTVEATFQAVKEQSPVDAFVDVNTGAWYYDAVKYAVENGLMAGVTANTFQPNATLSRAMIAQMLYALEGKPSVSAAGGFADVPANAWFAKAAYWAQSKSIITGYDAVTFGPNDSLTREQLALILYNYAKTKGYDTSDKANLNVYLDGSSTSVWAQEGMSWAVGAGLISGKGLNMLYPTGTATRAEVAQIMMNFCENVAK